MDDDTYLVAKYAERETVKALGARWDAARKSWYVPAGLDLAPFVPWLPVAAAGNVRTLTLEEPRAAEVATAVRRGITLSQLLTGVSSAVSGAFAGSVWTMVEVVNAHLHPRSGHVYLDVSERNVLGEVAAKATAIIWANTANRILPAFEEATGVKIGPGIKLLLRLKPVFRPQYGFSLEVEAIDPDFTLGDLEAKKREIRQRLQREGLFDTNRLLPAPWDYNAVLVVAPQGAAGLGDFKVEADRLQRAGICRFVYVNARFQGEGAAAEIRVALRDALQRWLDQEEAYPDAVVIIRGGGAANDLAWLNDYALTRCLCESPVPVLTGIGHERDSTLLDEVAHTKFDTPSKVIHGIEQAMHQRARAAADFFLEMAALSAQVVQSRRISVHALDAAVRSGALRHLTVAAQRVEAGAASVRVGAHKAVRTASVAAGDAHAIVHQSARHQIGNAKMMLPALMVQIQGDAKSAVRSAKVGATANLQFVLGSSGTEVTRLRHATDSSISTVASDARRLVRDAAASSKALAREVKSAVHSAKVGTTSALQRILLGGVAAASRHRESTDRSMSAVASDARRLIRDAASSSQALAREVVGQGPEKTLARGFAMVRSADGRTITSASQAQPVQQVTLHFWDGTVPAKTQPSGERD